MTPEGKDKTSMNPIPIFHNKHILLGVTGSIAAYKVVDLASRLTQAGAIVTTILTDSAARFVTPLTFRSVTGQRALTDIWSDEAHIIHVDLAEHAHLFVIAPASAHTIAKLAHGLADNLLTVTALAARCPIVLAPAMDSGIYANPVTQTNLKTLVERGFTIVGPASGRMASGLVGKGRLVEPLEIFGHARLRLARSGPLTGRHIVVTAGGTQEPLDPVRFITNRSSGKQGFAIAAACKAAGADVTLITGPVELDDPNGVAVEHVESARQMLEKVEAALPADIAIFAAAVADWRVAHEGGQKLKKTADQLPPPLQLVENPDILATISKLKEKRPGLVIGFAAETEHLIDNAKAKLKRKGCDWIVANDVSPATGTFGGDRNTIHLLRREGSEVAVDDWPVMTKDEVAVALIAQIVEALRIPA